MPGPPTTRRRRTRRGPAVPGRSRSWPRRAARARPGPPPSAGRPHRPQRRPKARCAARACGRGCGAGRTARGPHQDAVDDGVVGLVGGDGGRGDDGQAHRAVRAPDRRLGRSADPGVVTQDDGLDAPMQHVRQGLRRRTDGPARIVGRHGHLEQQLAEGIGLVPGASGLSVAGILIRMDCPARAGPGRGLRERA